MFLHNQHFQIYGTFTFDSHQTNVRFWLQKSIKIIPQTYKNRCWLINKSFDRFLLNFGSILGGFWGLWASFGSKNKRPVPGDGHSVACWYIFRVGGPSATPFGIILLSLSQRYMVKTDTRWGFQYRNIESCRSVWPSPSAISPCISNFPNGKGLKVHFRQIDK